MFKNKGNYPYPVLNDTNTDYTKTTFKVSYYYKQCRDEHKIKIVCDITNKDILRLINEGKACYAVQLVCTNTFLREMRRYNYNEPINISLKNIQVIDKIEIGVAIIATEDIKDFKSDDLIDVYQNMQINFNKNEPIAVAQSVKIDIVNDDEIFNEVHSIFNIIVDEKSKTITYDPYANRINVSLPLEIAGFYMNSKKTERIPVLNALIFVPVLVDLISQDAINCPEYDSFSWCKTLRNKISKFPKDLNISLENATDNALETTQELMKNLTLEAIYDLKNIFETFEDNGGNCDETEDI